MEPRLEVTGLAKAYRRVRVLHDLSIRAMAGEAVAVVGSNGAGKSTLLGCITGDRLPDAGRSASVASDPFSDPAAAAGCMGFVPEQPFLYPELTVGEMLRFVAEARGIEASSATERTDRLLALLALAGAEGALCRELSQGMGRKVAIIAALLHEPDLLILDEAFNGLDHSRPNGSPRSWSARRSDGAVSCSRATIWSSSHAGAIAGYC
jgi:ABC-2 type transport system ATP-binding protein